MSAKHTSGPWTIHRHSATTVIGPHGYAVATCGGHTDTRRDSGELADELVANARLIAAAPVFKEAAETMIGSAVDCGTYFKVDADDIAAFRAALSKARGESV